LLPVRAEPTDLPEVLVLRGESYADDRGSLRESFNRRDFAAATGNEVEFVQDNLSHSRRGVLRGVHYQVAPYAQGKLVTVVHGEVWDVAVDLRRSSPRFRKWVGVELVAEEPRQLWVPPGFGHGFLTLSDTADVLYKITSYHQPEAERSLRWDDPEVGIEWPLEGPPILSAKDAAATGLRESELFA
jgi:dTDP-4-dehydrorhamnose 3,5-epimerase